MGYESEMYATIVQDILPRLDRIEKHLGISGASEAKVQPEPTVEDLSEGLNPDDLATSTKTGAAVNPDSTVETEVKMSPDTVPASEPGSDETKTEVPQSE